MRGDGGRAGGDKPSGLANVKRALRYTVAGCAALVGVSAWRGDASGYAVAALGIGAAIGSLIGLRVLALTEEDRREE